MSSSLTVTPNKVPEFVAIDENVFLGTMKDFSNHSIIKEKKINRILILTSKRPDRLSDKVAGVFYKYIYFEENYTQNLIIFFPECYQYISEAQNYGIKTQ